MKYTGKKDDIKYVRSQSDKGRTRTAREVKTLEFQDEVVEDYSIRDNERKGVKRTKKKAFPAYLVFAGLILLFIELAFTVAFSISAINFGVIPPLMMAAIIIVLVAILVGLFFMFKAKKSFLKYLAMALSVIMSVILGVGTFVMIRTNKVITNISGDDVSVNTYYVVVRADDKAQALTDCADYTFGTMKAVETDSLSDAIAEVNAQLGKDITTRDTANATFLYKSLMDKEIGAILYNSSFHSMLSDVNDNFKNNTRVVAEITIRKEKDTPGSTYIPDIMKKPFVIYISGNDEFFEIYETGRTDVNILAVVNPVNHQVLLVTIPRDYYVPFPGITGDERDKLTHSGNFGIDTQLATVRNIFDIPEIDFYVKINFSSLIDIVDAIGGVDIYNPYAFTTTSDEGYSFDEGWIRLNGIKALWYARERKSIENGDIARGEHQMMLIEALIHELCSASSITHFNALMKSLEKCAITNMSDKNMKDIVQSQLANGGTWEIEKIQAEGYECFQPSFCAGGMELSVIMPYKESKNYLTGLIYDVLDGKIVTNVKENAPECFTLDTELVECEIPYVDPEAEVYDDEEYYEGDDEYYEEENEDSYDEEDLEEE